MTQGQLFIHIEKIMKLDPYLKPIKQKFRLKKRWNKEDKTEKLFRKQYRKFYDLHIVKDSRCRKHKALKTEITLKWRTYVEQDNHQESTKTSYKLRRHIQFIQLYT